MNDIRRLTMSRAKETGETKYKSAADLLRSQLDSNPRNSQGGFWHRSTYPDQMWLDGLYMGSYFIIFTSPLIYGTHILSPPPSSTYKISN